MSLETADAAPLFQKTCPVHLKLPNALAPQLATSSTSLIDRLHPSVTIELSMRINPNTRSKVRTFLLNPSAQLFTCDI